ncbi:inner membrane-spanning protein YciB [Bradyrhizobium prioriisuperbiae]|uniref:inner membrane-spanning protein YciB n=1 Tax=Bradyrhizobium prioriisuperbiae TaxID=2854389 RepID=UPI0028EDEDC7|nr:septation protein IspZ [Bradyrhizobium prioritasuperba]
MRDVFLKLIGDFLSTIVFLIVYALTGDVVIAAGFAIASAIGSVIYARVTGQTLDAMAWASLALVLVLGGATLLTNDPRFVLIKPSIAHFAIGAVMLRRGWTARYVPQIVRDTIPDLLVITGYAWAALMFVLGAGVVAVAMTGDMTLYTIYISVVAVGAKIAAFALQYAVFRIAISRRLNRQAVTAPTKAAALL